MEHDFHIFTKKFISELRSKWKLKLPPPLESVASLPCEKKVIYSTVYSNKQERLITVDINEGREILELKHIFRGGLSRHMSRVRHHKILFLT